MKNEYERCQVFVAHFWFVSWKAISFGLHLNLNPVHIEIHLPFCFIRIGMANHFIAANDEYTKFRLFGWNGFKWSGFHWFEGEY